jgi:hypothetical protein
MPTSSPNSSPSPPVSPDSPKLYSLYLGLWSDDDSPPPSPVDLVPYGPTASPRARSISVSSGSSYASTVDLVPYHYPRTPNQHSTGSRSTSSHASTVCLVPTSPMENHPPTKCNPADHPDLFRPELFRPIAVENLPAGRKKLRPIPKGAPSPPRCMAQLKRRYDAATAGRTRSDKLAILAGDRKSGTLGMGGVTKWRKRKLEERRREAKEVVVEMVGMWMRGF